MSYLARNHNLWHRVTLGLEKLVADQANMALQNKIKRDLDCYDFEPDVTPQQVCLNGITSGSITFNMIFNISVDL